ncbi:MAG: hypothetical protein LBI85_04950 [Spirochaetaceae bacterium]|nr:hypothetical protein [Spirochaetaceae bacterium]
MRPCIYALLCGLLLSCGGGESAVPSKPLLALSIVPQEWFARRIAGALAAFLVLAGPGPFSLPSSRLSS